MTRRIIKTPRTMEGKDVYGFSVVTYRTGDVIEVMALDEDGAMIGNILPKYKVGEVVAVAQPYCEIMPYLADSFYKPTGSFMKEKPGYHNKMFVKANLMPHQIRITNVRVERLKDISDEDCIREGIERVYYGNKEWFKAYDTKDGCKCAPTPKEAFATLIDKVSGNGTWQANTYCFCYTFERCLPR